MTLDFIWKIVDYGGGGIKLKALVFVLFLYCLKRQNKIEKITFFSGRYFAFYFFVTSPPGIQHRICLQNHPLKYEKHRF